MGMSEGYKNRIGNLIRDARKHRGLTQHQLADLLGTSQSAVNRIEKGHQNLSIEMLARIGEASGAGRVVLIQRNGDRDNAFMQRRAEWDAPGVAPLVTPPDGRGYRYFPRWAKERTRSLSQAATKARSRSKAVTHPTPSASSCWSPISIR